MKITLFLAALLVSQIAFAGHTRPCTNEVLTCKLGDQIISESFEGFNEDEPSMPPEECNLTVWMETAEGLIFRVDLGDKDYMASLYNLHRPYLGSTLPATVTFQVVKGKKFYFGHGNDHMVCELN